MKKVEAIVRPASTKGAIGCPFFFSFAISAVALRLLSACETYGRHS